MESRGGFAVTAAALTALALLGGGGPAKAGADESNSLGTPASRWRDAVRVAEDRVSGAAWIVDWMMQDPTLAAALASAKGVFVIPHYGGCSPVAQDQWGAGVVLARRGDKWTDPAFFSLQGASISAPAGGQSGAVVLLLMTPEAVNRFTHSTDTWPLNGSAGLTVASWSGNSQGNTGHDDVLIWSDPKGLFGVLTASIAAVTPQKDLDWAYYGFQGTSERLLSGAYRPSAPNATPLRNALPTRVASS